MNREDTLGAALHQGPTVKFRIYRLTFARLTFALAVVVAVASRVILGSDADAAKLFKEGFDSIQRGDFAEN